ARQARHRPGGEASEDRRLRVRGDELLVVGTGHPAGHGPPLLRHRHHDPLDLRRGGQAARDRRLHVMPRLALRALALLRWVGVAAGQERTLTWADGTDVATLDGAFTIDIASTTLLRHVAETLVKLNATLAVEPGLAESWSVAKDGVTWTFRLRRGP